HARSAPPFEDVDPIIGQEPSPALILDPALRAQAVEDVGRIAPDRLQDLDTSHPLGGLLLVSADDPQGLQLQWRRRRHAPPAPRRGGHADGLVRPGVPVPVGAHELDYPATPVDRDDCQCPASIPDVHDTPSWLANSVAGAGAVTGHLPGGRRRSATSGRAFWLRTMSTSSPWRTRRRRRGR